MKKGTAYRERKFEGSGYDTHNYSYGLWGKVIKIVVRGISMGHNGVRGSLKKKKKKILQEIL